MEIQLIISLERKKLGETCYCTICCTTAAACVLDGLAASLLRRQRTPACWPSRTKPTNPYYKVYYTVYTAVEMYIVQIPNKRTKANITLTKTAHDNLLSIAVGLCTPLTIHIVQMQT